MDEVFQALADSTRRIIISELAERGGQSLFEVCSRLAMRHGIGISRQAISKHLDVLERAGLVRIEREGRMRLHYLQTGPLSDMQIWIERHLRQSTQGEP